MGHGTDAMLDEHVNLQACDNICATNTLQAHKIAFRIKHSVNRRALFSNTYTVGYINIYVFHSRYNAIRMFAVQRNAGTDNGIFQ